MPQRGTRCCGIQHRARNATDGFTRKLLKDEIPALAYGLPRQWRMLNLSLVSRKCPLARAFDLLVLFVLVLCIGCTIIRAGQQFRTASAVAAPAIQSTR